MTGRAMPNATREIVAPADSNAGLDTSCDVVSDKTEVAQPEYTYGSNKGIDQSTRSGVDEDLDQTQRPD